jgi:hypothetical protein
MSNTSKRNGKSKSNKLTNATEMQTVSSVVGVQKESGKEDTLNSTQQHTQHIDCNPKQSLDVVNKQVNFDLNYFQKYREIDPPLLSKEETAMLAKIRSKRSFKVKLVTGLPIAIIDGSLSLQKDSAETFVDSVLHLFRFVQDHKISTFQLFCTRLPVCL